MIEILSYTRTIDPQKLKPVVQLRIQLDMEVLTDASSITCEASELMSRQFSEALTKFMKEIENK